MATLKLTPTETSESGPLSRRKRRSPGAGVRRVLPRQFYQSIRQVMTNRSPNCYTGISLIFDETVGIEEIVNPWRAPGVPDGITRGEYRHRQQRKSQAP